MRVEGSLIAHQPALRGRDGSPAVDNAPFGQQGPVVGRTARTRLTLVSRVV
jgi:hypothetical protein